jgi:hypothetical protein
MVIIGRIGLQLVCPGAGRRDQPAFETVSHRAGDPVALATKRWRREVV